MPVTYLDTKENQLSRQMHFTLERINWQRESTSKLDLHHIEFVWFFVNADLLDEQQYESNQTKKEIKDNLERFVSPNCKLFCTDGAKAYKFIEKEGYGKHIAGNHIVYFSETEMREEILEDGTVFSYKAHSNTAEGAVACFKKALRLCRGMIDDYFQFYLDLFSFRSYYKGQERVKKLEQLFSKHILNAEL